MPAPPDRSDLAARVRAQAEPRLAQAVQIRAKHERYAAIAAVEKEVVDGFVTAFRDAPAQLDTLAAIEKRQAELRDLSGSGQGRSLHDLRSELMRKRILDDGTRIDGRALGRDPADRVRSAAAAAPARHRAVHARRDAGDGVHHARRAERRADDRRADRAHEQALLPALQLPAVLGRRGAHAARTRAGARSATGNLAERALAQVLPDLEGFPYTIRVVSETLESNGSSSMATICGGTLSLMDAGVPLLAPVAGIAMGLIEEGDRVAILSDILGDEDHLGDMDFKVAGTRAGITALQMDIKIRSVDWQVLERALEQARVGRLHILDRMEQETAGEFVDFRPRTRALALCAAREDDHDQARSDPRRDRARRQGDPRHPGRHGHQDRHRRFGHRHDLLARHRRARARRGRWSTSSPRRPSSTASTWAR